MWLQVIVWLSLCTGGLVEQHSVNVGVRSGVCCRILQGQRFVGSSQMNAQCKYERVSTAGEKEYYGKRGSRPLAQANVDFTAMGENEEFYERHQWIIRSEHSVDIVCYQGCWKRYQRCNCNSIQDTNTTATYRGVLFTMYLTGYTTISTGYTTISTTFASTISDILEGSRQHVCFSRKIYTMTHLN